MRFACIVPSIGEAVVETGSRRTASTATVDPFDSARSMDDRAKPPSDHPVAFLNATGEVLVPLPAFAAVADELVALYRGMVIARRFDAKAVSLQRTGRLGTFASSLGQEAVGVGLAAAMRAEDVLVPSYRESAAMLWRGVRPEELLLYWGGDERGSDFAGPRGDFPISVPVGSHAPHAVGAAYAFKLRREPRVAVAVFGDGATSKGDVLEGLNAAGVWRVPVVFVVVNNAWAISVPVARQTAAPTLAHKALAFGLPGVRVDGNDVIAVRHVMEAAIGDARAGKGPTLVEAVTYRLSDHTTSDDARRYRPAEEVSARWHEEPIVRLRSYLAARGAWTREDEEALVAEVDRRIEAAVAAYEAKPRQSIATAFDFVHAALPRSLAPQRAAAVAAAERATRDA
jgi:pyruvate dehydrogenase E1 component alpha subunit